MPPASWAKWASHTRAERTGAASSTDDVVPKDFAVASTSKDSFQTWITDKDAAAQKPETKQTPQNFSRKLGKAMKTGLSKMLPSKPVNKTYAQLEFPELEILPTKEGYKDLQALETSIETMKSCQRAKLVTNPALALAELEIESKQSLSKILHTQLQEAEHARHHCGDEAGPSTCEDKNGSRSGTGDASIRPVTPANLYMLQAGNSTAATTEHWATPASRLSTSPSPQGMDRTHSETDDTVSVRANETKK